MNWICVLEQAVAGTLVIFLIVCAGIGIRMCFKAGLQFITGTEWYQRRAVRPPPRPRKRGKVARWCSEWLPLTIGITIATAAISFVLFGLYHDVIIPLGRTVLNVAMGRECL